MELEAAANKCLSKCFITQTGLTGAGGPIRVTTMDRVRVKCEKTLLQLQFPPVLGR